VTPGEKQYASSELSSDVNSCGEQVTVAW